MALEKLFGKVKQKGEGLSVDRNKTSISYNERLDYLIPAGKIASLRTGEMVGIIAKDFEKEDEPYKTSAINCKINLDLKNLKIEENNYRELPNYYDFGDKKDEILFRNFKKIKDEINHVVKHLMEESKKNKN